MTVVGKGPLVIEEHHHIGLIILGSTMLKIYMCNTVSLGSGE